MLPVYRHPPRGLPQWRFISSRNKASGAPTWRRPLGWAPSGPGAAALFPPLASRIRSSKDNVAGPRPAGGSAGSWRRRRESRKRTGPGAAGKRGGPGRGDGLRTHVGHRRLEGRAGLRAPRPLASLLGAAWPRPAAAQLLGVSVVRRRTRCAQERAPAPCQAGCPHLLASGGRVGPRDARGSCTPPGFASAPVGAPQGLGGSVWLPPASGSRRSPRPPLELSKRGRRLLSAPGAWVGHSPADRGHAEQRPSKRHAGIDATRRDSAPGKGHGRGPAVLRARAPDGSAAALRQRRQGLAPMGAGQAPPARVQVLWLRRPRPGRCGRREARWRSVSRPRTLLFAV